MENKTRSSLIMKLSKDNIEIHNVDQPMWKIQSFLRENENMEGEFKTELIFLYYLFLKFT